jgi:hypothetical protein
MTAQNPNQSERLAVLEIEVRQMKELVGQMDTKIDQLVDLRARGVGAFWGASAMFGTGIVGSLITVWNWIKGPPL